MTLAPVSRELFARRMAEARRRSRGEVGPSLAERLMGLPRETRLGMLRALGPVAAQRLLYAWEMWRRPKQATPSWGWDVWLILCGRGFGKTRTGAEWVRARVESGRGRSIALIGPSWGDVRRYMVGGHAGKRGNGSGLLDVCPPWNRPEVNETKGELRWPNGAVAYFSSAENTELRGPNLDTIWGDEPIKWPRVDALLDNTFLTLRQRGAIRPQMLLTTTPRPVEFLRRIIVDEGTHTTHGATEENAANVAASWVSRMKRTLAGTRQGSQELEAEVLGDNPECLFPQSTIDAHRVSEAAPLERIIVAIDPAVSKHRKSDATGIVVIGLGGDGDLYVLADSSEKRTPEEWGDEVVRLLKAWGTQFVVVERNRAGDLAAANVRAAAARGSVPVKVIDVLAMGDKGTRAEPLATLYAKGRVHHVGRLPRLEDEMTEWEPRSGVSPNGLDGLVHGAAELLPEIWGGEQPVTETPRGAVAMLQREVARIEREERGAASPSLEWERHGRGESVL